MPEQSKQKSINSVAFTPLLFVLSLCLLSEALPEKERLALLDMAAAIPGLQNLPQKAWNSSTVSMACSEWFGLSCQDDSVVFIYLDSLSLSGFLPDSIGNFSNLQEFGMFNNSLSGSIPASFARIGSLLSVSISSNNFSGSLPAELGVAQQLQGFYASDNNFTGTIPQTIGNPRLEALYVSNNRLSGTVPASLSLSTSLQELGIGRNNLEGPLPPLSSKLRYVYIDRNSLNGSLPDLAALPDLIEFYAGTNRFTGTISSTISSIQLRYLAVASNDLSGPLPVSLPASLLEIFMSQNNFNGTIPPTFFSSAPMLQFVSLSRNRLSGTIPASIARLQRLNYLYLDGNMLNGSIPYGASNLTSLLEISAGSGPYTGCFSKPLSLQSNNCFLPASICTCPEPQCGRSQCSTCLNSSTLACPLLSNGSNCFYGRECSSTYCSPSFRCEDPPAPTMVPSIEPLTATPQSSDARVSGSPIGAIVGGVVGAVLAMAVIVIIVLVLLRRRPSKPAPATEYNSPSELQATALEPMGSSSLKAEWMIDFVDLSFKAELGAGSYGTVWRGLLRGVTDVAIKQANLAGRSADAVKMFQKEAELMLTMRPHPNLIQTLGVAAKGDSAYIVMELCPNGSVESLFGKGVLTEYMKLKIILGLAKAVDHLHSNNIVHRDIAARNILLGEGNVPKLSDFGMSRTVQNSSAQSETKTDVGPIRWMAPESVESMSYSAASDVWTVGITIVEIWSEKQPFHEQPNLLQVVRSLMDGATPALPPGMPAFLVSVIQRCLQKSPRDRPSSREVCKALMEHIQG